LSKGIGIHIVAASLEDDIGVWRFKAIRNETFGAYCIATRLTEETPNIKIQRTEANILCNSNQWAARR
jgi:hypothetical protein